MGQEDKSGSFRALQAQHRHHPALDNALVCSLHTSIPLVRLACWSGVKYASQGIVSRDTKHQRFSFGPLLIAYPASLSEESGHESRIVVAANVSRFENDEAHDRLPDVWMFAFLR
eukprot:gb/GEZJ01001478.1/.p1 GENE.gb/GEZJ01001478.1/~~gb/GEZJ01001478.1/.p1  ORF type:complete len:115 (-),score=6.05 gb/GEZJ01001478.1/:1037-1381(-)